MAALLPESEVVDIVFDQPGTLGINFEETTVPVYGGGGGTGGGSISVQPGLVVAGILPNTQAASKPELQPGCAAAAAVAAAAMIFTALPATRFFQRCCLMRLREQLRTYG